MPVNVTIDESQFPEIVHGQLADSLRAREINHQLHYQSYRQAEKWHALHQAYAGLETNPDTKAIYEAAFRKTQELIRPARIAGLCCGYAEKEVRLLQFFPKGISFIACDTSVPIVLKAAEAAAKVIGESNCARLVCDVQAATDISKILAQPPGPNLFTFFGSIHNFEPDVIFPRLASLLKPGDFLLFSANMVPGPNTAENIMRIVPQYDNGMTFDWAFQLLADLGISKGDGVWKVQVEPCPTDAGLPRITLYFIFEGACSISVENERFRFNSGEALRVFYSYRYTPQKIHEWLSRVQLRCAEQWIGKSGEEGVFLAKK
jgi:L-histidine Nalpha-methyltransferase